MSNQEPRVLTVAEEKPRKGFLGCSSPVLIGVVIIFLGLFVVGFVAGPIGRNIFGDVGLPSWVSLANPPHVELPAQVIFNIFGFPITNSIIATWITMVLLVGFSIAVTRRLKIIPGRLQSLLEFMLESLLNFCKSVAGEENGRRFFPIVATIFLFVMFNAWLGLLPGYGSIGRINITTEGLNELTHHVESLHLSHEAEVTLLTTIEEASESLHQGQKEETIHHWEAFIEKAEEMSGHELTAEQAEELVVLAKEMEPHLLRPANTDINTPLAVAIISGIFVWFFGFRLLGVGYLKNFLNFDKFLGGLKDLVTGKIGAGFSGIMLGIIDIFIGIVEFLSVMVRNVSFTLRLFGNMTAGEILLIMVSFLLPFLVALPFYGLELLVGFVQALIFGGLTLIFLTVAATSHGEGH